jgi:hypothetical protein
MSNNTPMSLSYYEEIVAEKAGFNSWLEMAEYNRTSGSNAHILNKMREAADLWATSREQAAAAKAWDEGHRFAWSESRPTLHLNPYKQ